jgi:hypothetical protein
LVFVSFAVAVNTWLVPEPEAGLTETIHGFTTFQDPRYCQPLFTPWLLSMAMAYTFFAPTIELLNVSLKLMVSVLPLAEADEPAPYSVQRSFDTVPVPAGPHQPLLSLLTSQNVLSDAQSARQALVAEPSGLIRYSTQVSEAKP